MAIDTAPERVFDEQAFRDAAVVMVNARRELNRLNQGIENLAAELGVIRSALRDLARKKKDDGNG